MKKILYIVTSLILLLPNLSFGQVTYICSKPEITTIQNSYSVGSNLNLEIFQVFTGETATSEEENSNLLLNFIYPNGDTTSLTELTGEDGIYSVRNNLALADSGWYYVRFRQGSCPTTLDSIHITVTGGLSIPFYDNFNKMEYSGNYPNWEFKGVYTPNDTSALADKNIKSLWQSVKSFLDGGLPYNAVFHFPDSSIYSYPDSMISSIFLIPDTSNNEKKLTLRFDYAHYLADSTESEYDTLIVKAFIGNNETPVEIFKKGGLELRTTEQLDTSRGRGLYPTSKESYDWKRSKIDLSQYDTATTIKFMFILNPVPGLNYRESNTGITIIDDFKLTYIYDTLNPETPPTLTVDTVNNYDRTHTLTVHVPNNHNARVSFLYQKSKSGYAFLNIVPLDSSQTDTTYTYTVNNSLNGKYIYYTGLAFSPSDKPSADVLKEYSPVTVYTNFQYPPVGVPRLDVDSSRNKDRSYKLRAYLPPDHNCDIIMFYDGKNLIKTNELLGSDNELTVSDLTGGFKMIEYTRTKVTSGLHKHTVSIGNTQDGIYDQYDRSQLNLVSTDTLGVLVDTFTTPITDFNPVIENSSPSTGTYTLKIPLATRHKATQYEISENGRVISSGLLDPENRTSTSLNFKRKNAGTYTYSVRVFNNTTQIVKSNLSFTSTFVPAPVIDTKACTTSTLTSPNTSRTGFRYSFPLNPNCPTTSYKALFYSGQNVTGVSATNANLTQAQINRLIWKPELGSTRNSGFPNGNIKFTNAELTSKVFNRIASPLPALGNRWYKVEILCTTCTQTNKKRVAYFYVTN